MNGGTGERPSILIVDDDPAVVEALRAALEPRYTVAAASTGAGALDWLRREPFDLVLLDYVLPDASGLALLQQIKRACPGVLVLLMTAFGSEDVSVAAFRRGGRDSLRKPFTLPDLLARIAALLAVRRQGPRRVPAALPDPVPPRGLAAARAARVEHAIAFLDAHLASPLTLEAVARAAGLSPFHFARAFKACTGMTFRTFLAHRRVRRAAELLQDAGRSIAQVGAAVGFRDPRHFRRVFRKVTGQAPARYRRALPGTGRPAD